MTSVKICGITRLEDALVAAQAGADGIGFIFAPSPRRVTVDEARAIARRLPPLVSRVGVFVNAPVAEMTATAERVGLDVLQLHGDEGPEVAEQVREATRCRIVKAVRLRSPEDLQALASYPCDALLVDTYHPGMAGGTGKTFPWQWLQGVKPPEDKALWLAGGLHPGNVRAALEQIRPDGVDVSSGVEEAPGKKNPILVRRFIWEVRGFDLAWAGQSHADPT